MYTLWIEQSTDTVRFITSDLDHAVQIAEMIEKIHTPMVAHIKIYNNDTNELVYWIEVFSNCATVYHVV